MREFFRRPHPWIMQALGGLIAVILTVPLATWAILNVLNSKAPETAVAPLAPPPSVQAGGGGGQSAQPTPAANQCAANSAGAGRTCTVTMQPGPNGGFVFSPARLTINVGDTVHWVDADSTPHNIVGLGAAASLIKRTAINTDSYTVNFSKPGTYHYECQIHLPSMVGVITVARPGTSGGTGGGTAGGGSGGTTGGGSGGGTGGGAGAQTYTVKMQQGTGGTFVFSPASLSIHVGDTVHWVDVGGVPHNIVGLGAAASLIKRTAINTASYTVTFTKPGTYHYECQVHLPSMVGVITVAGSGTSGSSGGSGTSGGSGGSGTAGGAGAQTYTVKMQPASNGTFEFSPASLFIHAGSTVHWVDVGGVPHNIVGLGAAASLIKRTAINTDPYTVTFTKPGTYHYECQIHLPNMVGVITVT